MTRDDTLIAEAVEAALERRHGRAAEIIALHRLDSKLTTSYPVSIMRADLAGGGNLKILVKDFGSSRLPKTGRPPAREMHVYRDLLDGSFPDTPAFLGAVWSDHDRQWLVLEYIEADTLRNYGFEQWVEAARMLGRLHASFAFDANALESCPLLALHDADFFRGRAERARESLAYFDQAFGSRLERLLEGHDDLAERLGSLPQTLVHGSCRPRNLLVDEGDETSIRIVAIDWELAARGSGLYDLGFLAEGFVSPRLDVMLEAYRDGVRRCGGAIPEPPVLHELVDGFRLHKEIKSLGDAREFGFTERTVDKILGLGEAVKGIAP